MDNQNGYEQIFRHLDTFGVEDKDQKPRGSIRRKRKKSTYEKSSRGLRMTLDLHGCTVSEAERKFRVSLQRCNRKGIKEIVVVHGRGLHLKRGEEPVLKKLIHRMLETEYADRIYSYRQALPREGGEGATVVTLR
jgi:DNA-nicking Smr family endonuclease